MTRMQTFVELDEWGPELARMREDLRTMPAIEVFPAPEDEIKAEMAIKRGDGPLFPLAADVLDNAAELLVRGFVDNRVAQAAREVAADVLDAVQEAILSGEVEGPSRSAHWIRRKGNDINMVGLTRGFVLRLKSRVVNVIGGFSRDLASGRFVSP